MDGNPEIIDALLQTAAKRFRCTESRINLMREHLAKQQQTLYWQEVLILSEDLQVAGSAFSEANRLLFEEQGHQAEIRRMN